MKGDLKRTAFSVFYQDNKSYDGRKLAVIAICLLFLWMISLSISEKIYLHFGIYRNVSEGLFVLINSLLWLLFLSFFSIIYSGVISHFAGIDFFRVWKTDVITYLPFLFIGLMSFNAFAFRYLAIGFFLAKVFFLYKYRIINKFISKAAPESIEDIIAFAIVLLMTLIISNNLIANGVFEEDPGSIQYIGERIANEQIPAYEWSMDFGLPGGPAKYVWDLCMPFTYLLTAGMHTLFPSHETVLIVNVIFFVIFFVIFYGVVKHFFDKQIALISLILSINNPTIFWIVRSGYPYIISWVFVFIACISYFYARKYNLKLFFIFAGICTTLSVLAVPFVSFVLIFPILLEGFYIYRNYSRQRLKNLIPNMAFTAIGGIVCYLFLNIFFYYYANETTLELSIVRFFERLLEFKGTDVLYAPEAMILPVPVNLLAPLLWVTMDFLFASRSENYLIHLIFKAGVLLSVFMFLFNTGKTTISIISRKQSPDSDYYISWFIIILFVVYVLIFAPLFKVLAERWLLGYLFLLYIMAAVFLSKYLIGESKIRKYLLYFFMLAYCLAVIFSQYPKYAKIKVTPFKQAAMYINKMTTEPKPKVLCLTRDGTILSNAVYIKNIARLNKESVKNLENFTDYISKNNISFILYNRKKIPESYEHLFKQSNAELLLVEDFINKNSLYGKVIDIDGFRLVHLK